MTALHPLVRAPACEIPGRRCRAVVQLPCGTVAFLFTDVEGSPRLWQAHRAAMGRPTRGTMRSSTPPGSEGLDGQTHAAGDHEGTGGAAQATGVPGRPGRRGAAHLAPIRFKGPLAPLWPLWRKTTSLGLLARPEIVFRVSELSGLMVNRPWCRRLKHGGRQRAVPLPELGQVIAGTGAPGAPRAPGARIRASVHRASAAATFQAAAWPAPSASRQTITWGTPASQTTSRAGSSVPSMGDRGHDPAGGQGEGVEGSLAQVLRRPAGTGPSDGHRVVGAPSVSDSAGQRPCAASH